ncbi:MAG: lactonase family protein [Thermoguttaceae bacterium]
MPTNAAQGHQGRGSKLSRRRFLFTTTLAAASATLPAAASATLPAAAQGPAKPTGPPLLAYVGSYSSPQGPEGSKGYGRGIYLFEMDPASGTLVQRGVFANDVNPSWLALNPARTHLYAANETATYQGANSGSVSAYSIDRANGHLTLLNTVSSEGAGPAHLSVHPAGKHVLVANYAGGTVAVLPVAAGGELGSATDVKTGRGDTGPTHAASAPPGSFAISGHERSHAHMIESDPAGRFVFASDLGRDRIFIWKFDVHSGRLVENDPPLATLPPGDGPRHFAFHPSGRWLYSLQEEASTVAVFAYDAKRGRLTAKQTISSLPKGFAGTNFTSEIAVTLDGRFVYAANRLHDSIACFSIAETGELTLLGEQWTRGDYPRSFGIDPSGSFLFSCNQRSDAIAAFRRDKNTGGLTFTGHYTPVGTPAIIVFLA